MLDKMKGWDFRRAYSADGSTTHTKLTGDKRRLELRSLEILRIIPQLEASLKRAAQDIAWLRSLKWPKKGKWEKEKGTTVEEAVYKYEKGIVTNNAKIKSLLEERKKIPAQIAAIQKQLDSLVQGESKGLEKGLDSESAKALGEIELQKEKERLAHERALREAELIAETKRQELKAEKERQAMEAEAKKAEEAKAGKKQTKLFIGIGLGLLLLVGGIILYKRKLAKAPA